MCFFQGEGQPVSDDFRLRFRYAFLGPPMVREERLDGKADEQEEVSVIQLYT